MYTFNCNIPTVRVISVRHTIGGYVLSSDIPYVRVVFIKCIKKGCILFFAIPIMRAVFVCYSGRVCLCRPFCKGSVFGVNRKGMWHFPPCTFPLRAWQHSIEQQGEWFAFWIPPAFLEYHGTKGGCPLFSPLHHCGHCTKGLWSFQTSLWWKYTSGLVI